jgi:hypothetical protein
MWRWKYWSYRVLKEMRREHFDLDDAGYCLDARDRIS